MLVKVQCPCGAKYSFEVEPVEGRMPYAVQCPVCQAGGTELANDALAAMAENKPKLRIHQDAPAAEAPAPVIRTPVPAPERAMDRLAAERRRMRGIGWLVKGIALLILMALGIWAWVSFVATKPHSEFSLTLPGTQWHTEFLEPGKILMVSARQAILHDLVAGKDIWSTSLAARGGDLGDSSTLEMFADDNTIWVCLASRILRLDRASGTVKQTIPIPGQFLSFTPGPTNLVVVSSKGETTRDILQIDRSSGEFTTREVVVPRAEKHEMPNELPPNVQPTEGVLMAQANGENKFNQPLDAMRSDLFFSGVNLVEMRAKLVEPKVAWVQSIQLRTTPSGVLGQNLLNNLKSSETGGAKRIDESTYHVELRRWLGADPAVWQGDVVGPPMFFSLPTVDLLVAGTTLTVFDKQNNELFAARLSFALGQQFDHAHWDHQSVPAIETNSSLYFYDAGVFTAFSLPAGDVQWRLPSIGISRIQFDDQGALYIDTTAADPSDIQYSEQINLEGITPVLLKVDPRQGKILWQAENEGLVCFLSGKYVYTDAGTAGGAALAIGLAEAINAPRPEGPVYFHIYRLDPLNGRALWDFYRQEIPDEVSFAQNRFLLRFGDKLEAWKFLTF